MDLRLLRIYGSELLGHLDRLNVAQKIVAVLLARTVDFHLSWNSQYFNNKFQPNAFKFNTNCSRRTKRQRYGRNVKLRKRLREKKSSERNVVCNTPSKSAGATGKVNASKQPTMIGNVTSKPESRTTPPSSPATIKQEIPPSKDCPVLEKVPEISGMLFQLASEFRGQIKALQQVFDAELNVSFETKSEKQEPIVAEITIKDGCQINSKAFELVRSVILKSVGKLQSLKKPTTPIFYCMTNELTYINILCKDEYAYNFLQECFERAMTVSVRPLKARTDRLYCYSAIYKGIIDDGNKLLLQIRLHIPKMHTDHWIVANIIEMCEEEQYETHCLFLVDELSSLMLEHQYANKLLINLTEVSFHNHGQLPSLV
ncbi:uncharacterized protein [Eurosta solidaginis]|uniref:uncharacterized protein n=1 Tax=Eurosta solidaginis TaxID=178769 RepID=UPI0035314ECA